MKLKVWYEQIIVDEHVADLLVEGIVVVELKAAKSLDPIHSAQCINYLAATKLPLALLINFGQKVQVRRVAGPTLRPASVPIGAPSVANSHHPR